MLLSGSLINEFWPRIDVELRVEHAFDVHYKIINIIIQNQGLRYFLRLFDLTWEAPLISKLGTSLICLYAFFLTIAVSLLFLSICCYRAVFMLSLSCTCYSTLALACLCLFSSRVLHASCCRFLSNTAFSLTLLA